MLRKNPLKYISPVTSNVSSKVQLLSALFYELLCFKYNIGFVLRFLKRSSCTTTENEAYEWGRRRAWRRRRKCDFEKEEAKRKEEDDGNQKDDKMCGE